MKRFSSLLIVLLASVEKVAWASWLSCLFRSAANHAKDLLMRTNSIHTGASNTLKAGAMLLLMVAPIGCGASNDASSSTGDATQPDAPPAATYTANPDLNETPGGMLNAMLTNKLRKAALMMCVNQFR